MPDSYVLYGAQGIGTGASGIQLGTYVLADSVDFGAVGLQQPLIVGNPMRDGGVLAYSRANVRRMSFPMILPSGGLGGFSLTQVESFIRRNAAGGGYIDLQPANVPTAEAVRFDIISGRWEPDYDMRLNALSKRTGVMTLETQPYGYYPTWITLASVTNAGGGPLIKQTFFGASILGDAPFAPVRLQFLCSNIDTNLASLGGTYVTDFMAWSIDRSPTWGRPSMLVMASLAGGSAGHLAWRFGAGTFIADAFASAITPQLVHKTFIPPGVATGVALVSLQLSANYNYGGRHRLFTWAKLEPSGVQPLGLQIEGAFLYQFGNSDYRPFLNTATIIPNGMAVASSLAHGPSSGSYGAIASSAYVMYDLGEVSFQVPTYPIGYANAVLNVYYTRASTAASAQLTMAAIALLPLNGDSGIVPRGVFEGSTGYLQGYYNQVERDWLVGGEMPPGGIFAQNIMVGNGEYVNTFGYGRERALPYAYTSDPRFVPATDNTLTLISAQRRFMMSPTPMIAGAQTMTGYSLIYRPTFTFMKGL